jgi:hypothetical protein
MVSLFLFIFFICFAEVLKYGMNSRLRSIYTRIVMPV